MTSKSNNSKHSKVNNGGTADDTPVTTAPLDDGLTGVVPKPAKTPLYQATNALRYQRQAIIASINERTNRPLICYVAGDQAPIDRDDTTGFVDLLHNIPGNSGLDLLLHTGGGDIDVAEKLITMIREKVGNETLRVIVPDYAKSAGTLMAIGADCIIMSDTSELGPIDPQVILSDSNGNRIRHSVQSYLDAYDSFSKKLQDNPHDTAAKIMLSKLDPATVKLFETVKQRARQIAEDQLKRGMFKNGQGNWSLTASELINTARWQSHGQMISWRDAKDAKVGLRVDYMDPEGEAWQQYWQLYCLQRLAVGDREKLFESDYASLCFESKVIAST